jgi:hypothetical protein
MPGWSRSRRPKACSVLIESEPGFGLLFDAFSSREPVPTSRENAMTERCSESKNAAATPRFFLPWTIRHWRPTQ